MQFADGEIRVLDIQSRHDQASGINDRIAPNQHACGIDEKYVAIREELAKNFRGVCRGNAVQHRARGVLLNEARGLAHANIKTLPIDNGARRVGDI